MTEISAADTTDFYYNFKQKKILSKNNPNFFIRYFSGLHMLERGKTYKFVLKFGGFNFNFWGGTSDSNTDWVALEKSFQKDGMTTFLLPYGNKALSGEEYNKQDGIYVAEIYDFPVQYFKSKQQQSEMLKLFERAMLAFPASIEIEKATK